MKQYMDSYGFNGVVLGPDLVQVSSDEILDSERTPFLQLLSLHLSFRAVVVLTQLLNENPTAIVMVCPDDAHCQNQMQIYRDHNSIIMQFVSSSC